MKELILIICLNLLWSSGNKQTWRFRKVIAPA